MITLVRVVGWTGAGCVHVLRQCHEKLHHPPSQQSQTWLVCSIYIYIYIYIHISAPYDILTIHNIGITIFGVIHRYIITVTYKLDLPPPWEVAIRAVRAIRTIRATMIESYFSIYLHIHFTMTLITLMIPEGTRSRGLVSMLMGCFYVLCPL